MKHLPLIALLAVAASAHAAPPAAPDKPAAAKEFSLHLQQSTALAPGGTSVTFAGYVDQRCPSNVNCAVAGDARALLWVSGPNTPPSLVTLEWSGSEAAPDGKRDAKTVGNTRITLLALEPRPLMDATVNPKDYVVRFSAEPVRATPTRRRKH